jgi:hypothetical protein
MDIRFHLGWEPAVQILDEVAAKLYVDNPVADTLYTRVDVQVSMEGMSIKMMGHEAGCYVDTLSNYERNLYFLPFTEELTVRSWREDLGLVGKNPHWRAYVVNKVVHGISLQ